MALIVDTSQVAPSDRFSLWAEEASRVFFPMRLERGDAGTFDGVVHGCQLGPVGLHRLTAGASDVRRTPRSIGAADPETFQLAFELRGHSSLEQDGRSCAISPGTMFAYQTSRPFVIRNLTPFQMLVISFPLAHLRPHTDRLSARTGLGIRHRLAQDLVAPFLGGLDACLSEGTLPEGGADLGETIVDLVRSVLLQPEQVAAARYGESLLAQVTSYVYRHLGDPDLTPGRVAEANFISTRSLHRLWEPRGTGVAEWIRELRLARCRRDLSDPAYADESIAAIAARWGLRNPAHFSRLYRDAYGCSPTEHRPRG